MFFTSPLDKSHYSSITGKECIKGKASLKDIEKFHHKMILSRNLAFDALDKDKIVRSSHNELIRSSCKKRSLKPKMREKKTLIYLWNVHFHQIAKKVFLCNATADIIWQVYIYNFSSQTVFIKTAVAQAAQQRLILYSTSLPLDSTRWVWFTLSSLGSLF